MHSLEQNIWFSQVEHPKQFVDREISVKDRSPNMFCAACKAPGHLPISWLRVLLNKCFVCAQKSLGKVQNINCTQPPFCHLRIPLGRETWTRAWRTPFSGMSADMVLTFQLWVTGQRRQVDDTLARLAFDLNNNCPPPREGEEIQKTHGLLLSLECPAIVCFCFCFVLCFAFAFA